jgi:hypothetical protein
MATSTEADTCAMPERFLRWYDGVRRLMRERPLPRGPQEVAAPDDLTRRRHARECEAIGRETAALARRADAIGLPTLGYLLDIAALEADAERSGGRLEER